LAAITNPGVYHDAINPASVIGNLNERYIYVIASRPMINTYDEENEQHGIWVLTQFLVDLEFRSPPNVLIYMLFI